MRVGLALPEEGILDRAGEADAVGVWAVLVGGPAGTETARAAAVAARTRYVRVVVALDLAAEHPVTLAEEVAVLDNLAAGRAAVVLDPHTDRQRVAAFRAALHGEVVGGVLVAPPPVQPSVPIWMGVPILALSGDVGLDRSALLAEHNPVAFVEWTGDLQILARHLLPELATVGFPRLVAELADRFAP